MQPVLTGPDSLRRLFAAVTEQTFQVELGVADPPLIDYLADLLVRFVRMDAIFHVRNTEGKRLEEVAEMLLEASERTASSKRDIYRHIGDFTLFWSGVYPEALTRLRAAGRQDHLLDYCRQGRESYLIASTFDQDPYREEAPLLKKLSQDFELCSFGLNRVRKELDRLPQHTSGRSWNAESN